MMKKVLLVLMMLLTASMAIAMEQTPAPGIVVQEGDDDNEEPPIIPVLPDFDLVITEEYAYLEFDSGEDYGITVYVNGCLMESPYVFQRWEEDYLVDINVCFSEEGYNDIYVGRDYLVPALEGAPHDMNSDGRINIDDVTALIHYLLTLNTEGFNVEKADVDSNGRINIDDVAELINRLLNIPTWY